MNKDIAEMRKNYRKSSLDIGDLATDPIESFKIWFREAHKAEVPEPNAMTLATTGLNGFPSARIVLLKGVDDRGFIFYTNYNSTKGGELAANPKACLVFFWHELERQVRISGLVTRVSRNESEEYFHSRPRSSQIGAWTSPQSTPIPDKDFLNNKFAELEANFSNYKKIPLPEYWGGYVLDPIEIEFWQGRPSRLHDRILYSKKNNQWSKTRLAP